MIYIIAPTTITHTWELPFYLYSKCISNILDNYNIKNKIIDSNYILRVNKKNYRIKKNIKIIKNIISNIVNHKINKNSFFRLRKKINENDTLIIFIPYYNRKEFKKFDCNLLLINSEPVKMNRFKFLINEYRDVINNFKNVNIWDYGNYNLLDVICDKYKKNIKFSPFTYHPYLEEHFLKNSDNIIKKDIDFLLFGSVNDRRNYIISALKNKGYNSVIICTNDYKKLYNTIKRSKIILSIHSSTVDYCIDFYRLSFLLSNKIFVIHESTSEPDAINIFNKIIYSPYKNFITTCENWINKTEEERNNVANDIYEWWKTEHNLEKYIHIKDVFLKY